MNATTIPARGCLSLTEFVRSLTPEEKDDVIVELIREAVQLFGDSWPMPVVASDGELLGVFVPQAIVPISLKCYPPELTPEQKAQTEVALATPDNTFDPIEFLEQLRREDQD